MELTSGSRTDHPNLGLRVLHYTTWKERCGIASYAEQIFTNLASRGIAGDVFQIERKKFKYYSADEVVDFLRRFTDQAKNYDLIHIQHEFSFFDNTGITGSNINFFRTLDALERSQVPVVVTFHTEPFFLPLDPLPLSQRIKRFLRRKGPIHGWRGTDFFGKDSQRFKAIVHARKSRLFLTRVGFAERNITTIPMGIDARRARAHMSRAEAKRQLGLPEDCILLSLFGFIASYKGHETAVRAMNALSDRYRLAIVGGPHPEGGDKTIETMLKLSRKFGGKRLTITGYVDQDELDLYHAATDVCLAPYNDPTLASSAAITWAISSGKPVVASNIPTFREINEMHDCLLTVNPDCPEELAWQIEKLIANPAKQEELVANAEKYSLACSWDRVIDQMLPAYEELLRKKLPTAYSRCETAPTAHIGAA